MRQEEEEGGEKKRETLHLSFSQPLLGGQIQHNLLFWIREWDAWCEMDNRRRVRSTVKMKNTSSFPSVSEWTGLNGRCVKGAVAQLCVLFWGGFCSIWRNWGGGESLWRGCRWLNRWSTGSRGIDLFLDGFLLSMRLPLPPSLPILPCYFSFSLPLHPVCTASTL